MLVTVPPPRTQGVLRVKKTLRLSSWTAVGLQYSGGVKKRYGGSVTPRAQRGVILTNEEFPNCTMTTAYILVRKRGDPRA